MTVEPTALPPEEGLGVRLIDNRIVTETGIERIATATRALVAIDRAVRFSNQRKCPIRGYPAGPVM